MNSPKYKTSTIWVSKEDEELFMQLYPGFIQVKQYEKREFLPEHEKWALFKVPQEGAYSHLGIFCP